MNTIFKKGQRKSHREERPQHSNICNAQKKPLSSLSLFSYLFMDLQAKYLLRVSATVMLARYIFYEDILGK